MATELHIAVVGCGLMGTRRAKQVHEHPRTRLLAVMDAAPERALQLSERYGCRSAENWKQVVDDPSVDAIVVSTPNGYTAEIGLAALGAGKHVLIEKPPGRNLLEATQLAEAARKAGRVLKVGFNHRHHPAITRAHDLFCQGVIGAIVNIRARYGHGGRPGYEKEWRGDPLSAGGGVLMDQGVHIADLIHWFGGVPSEAFAFLQTGAWAIHPLEDNAFALFRYMNGSIASVHTSWTQWKNLFSFEIFGTRGSLSIEGLGGSYGRERLVTAVRNPEGGVPSVREEVFECPDPSWQLEWNDFLGAVDEGKSYWGTPEDGVRAMLMIDALYRSAQSGAAVSLSGGNP